MSSTVIVGAIAIWPTVVAGIAVIGSAAILIAIVFVAADFGGSDESREKGKSQ